MTNKVIEKPVRRTSSYPAPYCLKTLIIVVLSGAGSMVDTQHKILVTGATGYIGGRLAPRLVSLGYRVRLMVRDARRLREFPWLGGLEAVQADPLVPETLPGALAGVETVFYLIHSMAAGADFRRRDMQAATSFARAAQETGVRRIIYLGGLGDARADLSEHLQSRQETGHALRQGGVSMTEFRAAVVVGSGSISFEMVRNLTERLPVMICPQWVFTRVQPIAVEDVLDYLVAAVRTPQAAGQIIEIGGAEVLTYGQMMIRYGRVRGLRRYLIPVPVLTPRLSSYWVHWVTPVRAAYARPLIEGLRSEVIVKSDIARKIFPDIRPVGYEAAVRAALRELNAAQFSRRMPQTLSAGHASRRGRELTMREGMIVERRRRSVSAPASHVYEVFSQLGGRNGWLCCNWVWRLRALLDRALGGVGMRRTDRTRELRNGDTVDFYRVEAVEPGRLLRLRVEMKLPGEGWVQFQAEPHNANRCELVLTVFFAPRGLTGLLYWWAFYPAHAAIFPRLLRGIARRAQRRDQ